MSEKGIRSKGIYQRKDGLYSARYYGKSGKRKEKYFDTLPEAKNWLADARYEERHNLIVTAPDMTVDKWFNYWIENIVCDLAPNAKRNVHVTDESLVKAVQLFEAAAPTPASYKKRA